MNVVGVAIKSGEYQGHNYCNVMIYGTEAINDGVGLSTRFEKVKHAKLCEILDVKTIDSKVMETRLMGKNIEFSYDKYRNVNYIHEIKAG